MRGALNVAGPRSKLPSPVINTREVEARKYSTVWLHADIHSVVDVVAHRCGVKSQEVEDKVYAYLGLTDGKEVSLYDVLCFLGVKEVMHRLYVKLTNDKSTVSGLDSIIVIFINELILRLPE